jgi:hypothetical protein
MRELRPKPTARHVTPSMFILKDLYSSPTSSWEMIPWSRLFNHRTWDSTKSSKDWVISYFSSKLLAKKSRSKLNDWNRHKLPKRTRCTTRILADFQRAYPGKKKLVSFASHHHNSATGGALCLGVRSLLPALAPGQRTGRTPDAPCKQRERQKHLLRFPWELACTDVAVVT